MVIGVSEAQVIFRLDDKMLKELDKKLATSGFRTRNEWFRHKVREFLEEMERKEAMKMMRKLEVEGLTEEEIVKMVKKWRKET